ncbi:hypothetical protein EON63_23780, partial [archaeon]
MHNSYHTQHHIQCVLPWLDDGQRGDSEEDARIVGTEESRAPKELVWVRGEVRGMEEEQVQG